MFVRGFYRYGFLNVVLLGYSDGTFLGRVNEGELGASDGIFLGNSKWTPVGWFGRTVGQKLRMGVNSGRQMEFSWGIYNWTLAG